jgi:hypothetical protein
MEVTSVCIEEVFLLMSRLAESSVRLANSLLEV